jgi:hypothetical protein
MRVVILALALGTMLELSAAGADFFPLAPGNQWVYRVSGGGPSVALVEVLSSHEQDGKTYFQVRGFLQQDVWLRGDEQGNVFRLDPDSQTESLLYAFGLAAGQQYQTSIHPCDVSALIDSKPAHYQGPAGTFDNAAHIVYTDSCNFAGLFDETFVPGIGLVQRGDTAVGQYQYNLIYAHLGSTVVTGFEVEFGLSLDQSVYINSGEAPLMLARLSLRVAGNEPLQLVFPSGQIYELLIRNGQGDIVYRWSDGRAFNQMVQQVAFGPGEKSWPIVAPLQDAKGNGLSAGSYTAEAWLVTNPPKRYVAQAGFEIR